MTQPTLSPNEIATRQLIEWCARIERRRRVNGARKDAAPPESTPRRADSLSLPENSPTRVA
jgi:hypothetical protein